MQLHIVTIGKDRRDDYGSLIERYSTRLPWNLTLHEKLPKKPNAPLAQRLEEEANLLLSVADSCDIIVALDETGKALSSPQLAQKIGAWRDAGQSRIAFLIGGADGLHPVLRQKANLVLALGSLTWPHQMVRLMLAEQLYRAHTLLSGHPYHRE